MRNVGSGNPLVVQWLGLSFHCRGHGFNSILGRGSKILQATHGGTQKQKDGCSIAWHPQPPSPIDSLSSDFLGTCKNSHHVAPRPLAEEMLGHHNLITSWTSFAQLWKYYISNYEFCMAHLQKKLFCWCAEESQPHEGRSKEASQAKFQIWRVLGWDSVLPLASFRVCVCVCAQSCLTLCNTMDCGPPGSSVHGTLQAITLEWVAISYSRGSSQPRDWTHFSCIGG